VFRLAKPLILAGFAGVLIVLAGLLLFDTPLEYRLACDRAAGRCTFTQRLVSKTRTGSAPIAALRQAEIRVTTPRRGRPQISVWIVGTGGPFFVADYASRDQAGADAGGIDRFLHDASLPRLSVRRDEENTYRTAWILIGVSAVMLGGLAAALFSKRGRLSRGAS